MVTPSDRLSKASLFAKGFVIAFASISFLDKLLFILVAFLNRQRFIPVQTTNLAEHGSLLTGDYLPGLTFAVHILFWSNNMFIMIKCTVYTVNRHYIYRSCFLP